MSPRHTRQTNQGRQPVAPLHRGPQAASVPLTHLQPPAAAVPLHAPNAALLIDFDNVTMGIRSDLAGELKTLLSSDIVRGKVSVQRAYADWRRYPQYIVPLSESSIDLIFAPAYGSSKKNATDIRLAIDALELVFTRPEIGTFILLSGDSDFSSLVIKLKEYGKYVIGVGIRESSSDLLVQNCDEYYSYNALAGLVNTRDEEVIKWDPWELAAEAIQRMKRNGDVMRADRLKQVMQQIDSSFDEKNLGMSKFSRFVIEASHRSILTLNKMENGQYEVDLPKAVSITDTDLHEAQDENGAADASASAEHGDDKKGPRSRGRKGWKQAGRTSGYSRGRSGPRNETDVSVADMSSQEMLAADASATEISSSDVPSAVTETPDVPPPVVASRRADVKASDAAVDDAGMSGMRLTRNEAFDLVKRAVAEAATGDKGALGSVVRQTARRLLGRDSESLSERNFTRILQDAHNADIVDLRRRGNDFEVSPAATVDTIADQLLSNVAEQKESEAAAAGAATARPARGMGPRGIPSRGFGKKGGEIPADLLSLGVVSFVSPSAPKADEKDAQPVLNELLEDKSDAEQLSASSAAASSSTRGRKKGAAKRVAAKTAAKAAAKTAAANTASTAAPARSTAAKSSGSKSAGSKTAAKSATGKTAAAKSTAAKSAVAKTATAKSASTAAKGVKRAPRKTAARKAAAAAKNA